MPMDFKAGWGQHKVAVSHTTVKNRLLILGFGKAKRSSGMEEGKSVSISNWFLTPCMSSSVKHHYL